ncbi:putative gustatory receptor 28b [Onthophagus taurus]|uniref:putative gustatory receptor 28b n=1 Tax=Onthophagus taurus TaxID=166361 RepID=UPI0039BDEB95
MFIKRFKRYFDTFQVSFMIPLLEMGILLGQHPPCILTKKYFNSKKYKLYAFFMVLLILNESSFKIGSSHSLTSSSTIQIMNELKQVCTCLQCLMGVFQNSFLNPKNLYKISKNLRKLDVLMKTKIAGINKKRIFIEIIIYFGFVFGLGLSSAILTRLPKTWYFFLWVLCDFLENAICFTTTLMMLYFLFCIESKFKILNGHLKNCIEDFNINKKPTQMYSVKTWIETYTILTETIDLFNRVFGWQILLIFINSLLGLLVPINNFLVSSTHGLDDAYFAVFARYLFFILFSGVFLSKIADNTHEESRRTGLLCYKILQSLPEDNLWNKSFQFREEMVFFAKETCLRCPKFSAAGFLTVDFSMLFVLINSMSTYVVVLIQFNK